MTAKAGASGKLFGSVGTADIAAKIAEALNQMPPKCARQFSAYLSECANAVQKKGEEWQEIADSQFNTARELRKAAAR